MSKRAEIRQKIVELIAGKTQAEDRVFSNRARRIWPEECPLIVVYSKTETVQEFEKSPRSLKRELQIAIECIAKADENIDDTLDEIAQEVETALGSDESLGNLCADIILEQTEMNLSGDGETVFGAAILTYQVTYITELVEQDGNLEPLEGFNVAYDLKPDESLVEAEDIIDVPTS